MIRKTSLICMSIIALNIALIVNYGCAPKNESTSKDPASEIIGDPNGSTPDTPSPHSPNFGPGQTGSFIPTPKNEFYLTSIGGQFKISNISSITLSLKGSVRGFAADSTELYFLFKGDSLNGLTTYSIIKYSPVVKNLTSVCQFLEDQYSYGGLQFDGTYFYTKAYISWVMIKQIALTDCTTANIEFPATSDSDGFRPKYYDFQFIKVQEGYLLPFFTSSQTRLKLFDASNFRFTTYADELKSGVEKLRYDSKFTASNNKTWVLRTCESITDHLCIWLMKNDGSRLAWAPLPSSEYPDFRSGYTAGQSIYISAANDDFYFVWSSGNSIHLYQLDISLF